MILRLLRSWSRQCSPNKVSHPQRYLGCQVVRVRRVIVNTFVQPRSAQSKSFFLFSFGNRGVSCTILLAHIDSCCGHNSIFAIENIS